MIKHKNRLIIYDGNQLLKSIRIKNLRQNFEGILN